MSQTHSYAIWDPESEITLCNVPWDIDYNDTVRFATASDLDAYIDAIPSERKRVIGDMSYIRAYQPINLEDPFNTVAQYNYVRVRQPGQNVTQGEPPKTYYYFITSVTHIAPNNTQITVDLDVWSTYIYDVTFQDTYVIQGHVGIAQRVNFPEDAKVYYTAPESLDIGKEYYPVTFRRFLSMDKFDAPPDVLIASSIDLSNSNNTQWGTEEAPKTPVPGMSNAFSTPQTMDYGVIKGEYLGAAMRKLARYPWIAQGIVGIKLIPAITRYLPNFEYGQDPESSYGIPISWPGAGAATVNVTWDNWRDIPALNMYRGRYENLKKFFAAPYTLIEMTTEMGSSIFLRPELFSDNWLLFREELTVNLGHETVTYRPANYETRAREGLAGYEDLFVEINPLPALGLINDAGALAVANQAYVRQYQNEAIDLADQQSALQVGNMIAQGNLSAQNTMAAGRINRNASINQANLSVAQNNAVLEQNQSQVIPRVVQSALGGAAGGALAGPYGMVAGGALSAAGQGITEAFSAGNNIALNNITNQGIQQANNIAVNQSRELQDQSLRYAQGVMDANASLAQSMRAGNRRLEHLAIETATKSARLTPPSVVAMAGGSLEKYGRIGLGLRVNIKTIQPDRVKAIGEYWLRYGYAINAYINVPRDLHVMSHFTYWQMMNTYIDTAPMPESFKQTIRGIMKKGTTVHKHPDSIGRMDPADNQPIIGDYYV